MSGISVVVTTFNDGHFLERALRSIDGQTVRPKEIIVVDDGSDTNEAEQVVSRTEFSLLPIKYVRQANGGPSSARNTGIRAATQEFVAFLDVDDVWLPTNLEHKLTLLRGRSHSYLGAYGSFVRDDMQTPAEFGTLDGSPTADRIGKPRGFPGGAPAFLFRRDPLLAVGGFDEDLFVNEDFDLLLRLIRCGYKVVGDSRPGFVRTMRIGSLTRNSNPLLAFSRVSKFLKKAEAEAYFQPRELKRRWMRARFALVRGMLASGAGAAATASAVRTSFSNPPPGSIAELLVLWLARVIPIPPKS